MSSKSSGGKIGSEDVSEVVRGKGGDIVSVRLKDGGILKVGSIILIECPDPDDEDGDDDGDDDDEGDVPDGFRIPFVGVVRRIYEDERGEKQIDLFWLYHETELGQPPQQPPIKCRAEFVQPTPKRSKDKGNLKELWWSSHADTVSLDTVLHLVVVHVLSNRNDERVMQQVPLQSGQGSVSVYRPGFICSMYVDMSDWSFHSLKSMVKHLKGEEAALLQMALKRTEEVLRGGSSDAAS